MVTQYEVKQQIAQIVEAGHYSNAALKAAHDYLIAVNDSMPYESRCTGQPNTRPENNYMPSLTFCKMYECWLHGDGRVLQDIERAIAGMYAGDYGQLRRWFFVTITDTDATRQIDSEEFQSRIQRLCAAMQTAAKRNGHKLRWFAYYGFKQSGQIHAHIVASWLPDAILSGYRSGYTVMSSKWLKSYCEQSELSCHIEIVSDAVAVANYITKNVKSTLHRMPYNAVRVSFSRSWLKRHEAQASRLDIVQCQHCGQVAIDTGCRCNCGRSKWTKPRRYYVTSEELPKTHLATIYKTEVDKPPFKLTLKRCSKCKAEYPLTAEYWHKDKSKKTGYEPVCKRCRRKRDAKRNRTLQRQFVLKASGANERAENAAKRHSKPITGIYRLAASDVSEVYYRTDGHCAYCPAELDEKWELDHYTPLSRNGDNTPDNLRASCPDCNKAKHSMTRRQWMSWLAAKGIVTDDTPDWMPIQSELFNPDNIDT